MLYCSGVLPTSNELLTQADVVELKGCIFSSEVRMNIFWPVKIRWIFRLYFWILLLFLDVINHKWTICAWNMHVYLTLVRNTSIWLVNVPSSSIVFPTYALFIHYLVLSSFLISCAAKGDNCDHVHLSSAESTKMLCHGFVHPFEIFASDLTW